MKAGPKNLITDVRGILVGNSEDHEIRSGVSLVVGDKPFVAGVHVMGGAPGTRETDLLAPERTVQEVDAVVLSGGSAFGLDAASGVADALAERGRGFRVGEATVPIVPGAILFDLLNGGDKSWSTNPYKEMGRRALANADDRFETGSAGAGLGATTHDLRGGLGSASVIADEGFALGALVAVNAMGSVVQNGGPNFWASPFEIDAEFGGLGPASGPLKDWQPRPARRDPAKNGNTTIAIVATDASLTQSQATRLAIASHAGLARAIVPSHSVFDGDLVFSVATGEVPRQVEASDMATLCHLAATCLARAVARGIYTASPNDGEANPAWVQKFG